MLGAITSTLQRLKLYNRAPPNGLILYCGQMLTEDGIEEKVTFDLELFKPINTAVYFCDNKFHTEDLAELLESDDKFGFLIMDEAPRSSAHLPAVHRQGLSRYRLRRHRAG